MTKPKHSPEAKARKRIDKMLQEAGWSIIREGNDIPSVGNFAAEEVETDSGPMDYALVINGTLVGDVEAKPEKSNVPAILDQDERYSKNYLQGKFNFGEFHIPFIYASNGHIIQFRDVRSKLNLSRQISKFHTPTALKELLDRNLDQSFSWLKETPIDTENLRSYQQEAIESCEIALMKNKKRMMIHMATGTGKTRVASGLIYRLLKSGAAKRILYLVDRRSLAAQTINEFSTYEPEPTQKLDTLYEVYSQKFRQEDALDQTKFKPNFLPLNYFTNPNPNHTFVYVSTIQGMRINLFGREDMPVWVEEDYYDHTQKKLDIPIHAFDLIIADECHRGYTILEESKWREVLDHFDAIKIGFTATPAKHSTEYFEEIVYSYPIEKAIQSEFLVDWDLINIDSGIRMKGLFLKKDEEVQLIDPHTGQRKFEFLEDEREFKTSHLERKAAAPDTNHKIIKQYADYARDFENRYGRFPKTIVFATTDVPHTSHADRLVEWLKKEFPEKGDSFVKKITGTVDRPLQKIREFRNLPQEPGIAVTVDLLSTGVDIPTVEAILIIKTIKSRILYEQILGRGVRLAPDIGKTHFTLLDAVGVVEYFKDVTDFPSPLSHKPSRTYKQIIDELNENKNREYNLKILTRRLKRISKSISSEGREKLTEFIDGGDLGKFSNELPDKLEDDFTNTMKILQDPSFQYQLTYYQKIKDDFILATDKTDIVSSEHYPIVIQGEGYKLDEYLELFREFLDKQSTKMKELIILLKKPKKIDNGVIETLKEKLSSQTEKFTEENLCRAFNIPDADLIGMIHSTISKTPYVSTKERAKNAIKEIIKTKNFSKDEKKWLEMLQNHLEFNVILEKQHFNTIPFSDMGSIEKAKEILGDNLKIVLARINGAMIK